MHADINVEKNKTTNIENDIQQLITETNNLKNRSRYEGEYWKYL